MNNQSIRRARKDSDNPYKAMSRALFEDSRLSFEARGVLGYILVKPDDWRINITDLQRQGGIGRDKAYKLLNELIEFGYCERIETRSHGKISGYEYLVHEEPLPSFQEAETTSPLPDLPYPVLPLPVNTHHTNKEELLKKKLTKKEKEIVAPQQTQATPSSPVEKPVEEKPQSPVKAMTDAWTEWKRVKEPGAVINYGQEGKAAKALVKAGWSSDQVIACANILFADAFYSNSALSLWTVAKQIGAKLRHSPPKDAAPPPAIIMDFDAIFGVSSHATH